jgi:DNA-binding MarR family transcriptional regulator
VHWLRDPAREGLISPACRVRVRPKAPGKSSFSAVYARPQTHPDQFWGDLAYPKLADNKHCYYVCRMAEPDNLGTMVADVSHLMRRAFDERARGIGLSRPQWRVLTMLRRNEGINQGGLAELVEVEPITLCRMVDRLQEADLVERRADPADRRAWRLHLTEKARAILEEMRPMAFSLFDEAMTGLDAAERSELFRMLERIRTNLSRRTPQELISNG